MLCSQCGAQAVDDAKFCSNCGAAVVKSESTASVPLPVVAPPTKPRSIWLFVFVFILVPVYASMFLPAFAGRPQVPQAGNGSMWATGLFFYFYWRHLGKKGWQGALIGALLGVSIFFLASFVGGYVRHSHVV